MPPRQERGPQPEQFIQPYVHRLGILWRVIPTVDPAVDRPSIASSRDGLEHRISFPPGHMEAFRCDIVHELTHAKLAETIDPIFSTIRFHSSYDIDDPTFRQQARMVYFAQMPVEVWVADHMHTVDPSLVQEDVSSWFESVLQIPGETLRQRFAQETMMTYAINYADIRRHDMRGFGKQERRVFAKLEAFLGPDAAKVAKRLARHFKELPQLPTDPTHAIPLLEQKTQETAQIIGFPIRPTLVEDRGNWVWQIEAVA